MEPQLQPADLGDPQAGSIPAHITVLPPMRVDEERDEHGHVTRQGADYYLKPMNCPAHIQIFKQGIKSYRDLPIRLAELGTVYRYERSGTLHGMLRVRGFTQDDSHIFCTPGLLHSARTPVRTR